MTSERADRRGRRRWAERLEEGEEPDYRFTLANERTFLAWIRTSLALLAGGLAVGLVEQDDRSWLHDGVAVLALVLGATFALLAYRHWAAAQRAMRHGERLPIPSAVPILSASLTVLAAGLVLLVLQ